MNSVGTPDNALADFVIAGFLSPDLDGGRSFRSPVFDHEGRIDQWVFAGWVHVESQGSRIARGPGQHVSFLADIVTRGERIILGLHCRRIEEKRREKSGSPE